MTDEQPQDHPTPPAPAAPLGEEHAKISSGYRMRIGLMGLMLIGWGAYCWYDAVHAFPKHDALVERVEPKLKEFKDKYGSDRGQWIERWDEQLHEPSTAQDTPPQERWPSAADADKLVTKGKHTQFTYLFNWVMLAMSAPFGVLYLVGYVRAGGRWIHMDDAGFTTHNGRSAPFDKITKFNKERWRNKGIAVIHHQGDDGKERTLVLDDWKFEREPIERMLLAVQSRLSPDQIVGDKPPLAELVDPDAPPEVPPDAPADAPPDESDAVQGNPESTDEARDPSEKAQA